MPVPYAKSSGYSFAVGADLLFEMHCYMINFMQVITIDMRYDWALAIDL